ncbi:hypothetical protein GQ457_09G019300 [Hibiscus cannabinus]
MFHRDKKLEKPHDTSSSKLKINPPTFKGTLDPDAYFDREKNIELMVTCYEFNSDYQRFLLDISGFSNHTKSWWNRLVKDR